MVPVPIGDCTGTVNGQGTVPILDVMCFFLTTPVAQSGGIQRISGEFIDEEDSRVRFLEFGEYAQELELYVYIKTKIFSEYLEHREDINLKINDIVESVGVKLVIPARTSYIKELPSSAAK